MRQVLLTSLMFQAIFQVQADSQVTEPAPTARVRVIAFEANGRFLGTPHITAFSKLDDRHDLASTFNEGLATGVPFGLYRIEGRIPWYYSDAEFVSVYQPVVTVVLGLRFAQELPQVPPNLQGRVIGLPGPTTKHFVKLIGVYEHVSNESSISSDGTFVLGGLSPGRFLILVVGETGILASKDLTIPYIGPPLEIEVVRSRVKAEH